MVSDSSNKKAFVVTTHLGTVGGGALAPLLLCRELAETGLEVTAFTQHLLFGNEDRKETFRIVTPGIRRGCRWDIPGRVLSRKIISEINKQDPDYIIVCGVTRLARYLLFSPVAGRLLVWEFTNATQDNRLVDSQAGRKLNGCKLMLSPSASIDEEIRRNYGYKGAIERLPFWITDHSARISMDTQRKSADFVYLGRRDIEKGLMELIAATYVVSRKYPEVSILITGPGREEPYAREAERLGVARNISFRFFETYSETLQALASAKCLVLPSYHEGYPLVLLEAAQFSVPFIATRVGSVAEIFEGSEAGLIIPPKDEGALAEAMLQILGENEETYNKRKSAARKVFERVSSKQAVKENLERVLKT